MDFHACRRQQFLSEEYYLSYRTSLERSVELWKHSIPADETELSGRAIAFSRAAKKYADLFLLRYTAGEMLDDLRRDLPVVVELYEIAAKHLRAYEQDESSSPLIFSYVEEYERAMQLIGLCFLLHRTELLPRLSALFDGLFAGDDNLYEDLLSCAMDGRYEGEELMHPKPYLHLMNSFNRESDEESNQDIEKYLKSWYLSMKAATWHDSHLNLTARGPGYYGYWAIEAAAVAYVLELDDSAFRDHLVYPKDLIDFARKMDAAKDSSLAIQQDPSGMRVEGGQSCPQAGYWATPAKQDGRRLFKAGEIMPVFENSAYGATIWQWSEEQ